MRRKTALGALFILVALSAQCQQRSTKREAYKSPDGSLIAVVKFVHQPEATSESEVLLQTPSGKVLARRDYRSEDGEHGFGVAKAQWTPDSQFFVYSLDSSGGHQAWHSPVQYFSRKSGRFLSLDDALKDAVMNSQFSVEPPDKVTVELYFANKASTVSLSSLKKERRSVR